MKYILRLTPDTQSYILNSTDIFSLFLSPREVVFYITFLCEEDVQQRMLEPDIPACIPWHGLRMIMHVAGLQCR